VFVFKHLLTGFESGRKQRIQGWGNAQKTAGFPFGKPAGCLEELLRGLNPA
jgi:hypothetical protein